MLPRSGMTSCVCRQMRVEGAMRCSHSNGTDASRINSMENSDQAVGVTCCDWRFRAHELMQKSNL